jgi:hypothetical protein
VEIEGPLLHFHQLVLCHWGGAHPFHGLVLSPVKQEGKKLNPSLSETSSDHKRNKYWLMVVEHHLSLGPKNTFFHMMGIHSNGSPGLKTVSHLPLQPDVTT